MSFRRFPSDLQFYQLPMLKGFFGNLAFASQTVSVASKSSFYFAAMKIHNSGLCPCHDLSLLKNVACERRSGCYLTLQASLHKRDIRCLLYDNVSCCYSTNNVWIFSSMVFADGYSA